jgi:hypothetical protein
MIPLTVRLACVDLSPGNMQQTIPLSLNCDFLIFNMRLLLSEISFILSPATSLSSFNVHFTLTSGLLTSQMNSTLSSSKTILSSILVKKSAGASKVIY